MNTTEEQPTPAAVEIPQRRDGICKIATALAKAQARMGKAIKTNVNTDFKSKYADLSDVIDACMPALLEAGIAVIQPTGEDDHGPYVKTILMHGESGEMLSCRVPLIVSKQDMQGYGSAVTYARRYGLMCMTGIAPEDDDGNAAAQSVGGKSATITQEQFGTLRNMIDTSGADEDAFCRYFRVTMLDELPASRFDDAVAALRKKIEANKKSQKAPKEPESED